MKVTSLERSETKFGHPRFGTALALAAAVHVLLLGVNFSATKKDPALQLRPIEVILVQERSATKPKNADFLAQANLQGASVNHADSRPAAPLVAPQPDRDAHVAELPAPVQELSQPGSAVAHAAEATAAVVEGRAATEATPPKPELSVPVPRAHPAMRVHPAELKPNTEQQLAHIDHSTDSATAEQSGEVDAARLISSSFALASLSSEIDQRLESRSKRLRQKFVSASTQEYRYASYMEAWRAKVERIGNLNYPEQARQQHLSGNLLLDVSLNPDGTVLDIVIRRPSGHKELDEAAVRIVQLSAPFAPFPEDIRREVDVLHITRSWQFLHNYQFASKS